jgi:putative DNA-invertase from lambdoid prophage Rac
MCQFALFFCQKVTNFFLTTNKRLVYFVVNGWRVDELSTLDKAMSRTLAYLRVSTSTQDLNKQRQTISDYAESRRLTIDDEISITIASGRNSKSRRIDELLSVLKSGDTLVIAEISRLGRSISELLNILNELRRKHIVVHIAGQKLIIDDDDNLSRDLTITCLSMCAQIEKSLIRQRTKDALQALKNKGVILGNKNISQARARKTELANDWAENLRGIFTDLTNRGLSQRMIVETLNQQGINARNGGAWSLRQVQRVIERLGSLHA